MTPLFSVHVSPQVDLHGVGISTGLVPPVTADWKIRDLWTHTNNGTLAKGGAMIRVVPAGDVVMFTLSPESYH